MNPSSKTRYAVDAAHKSPSNTTTVLEMTNQLMRLKPDVIRRKRGFRLRSKVGPLLALMLSLLCLGCRSPQSSTMPRRLIGRAPTTLAVGDTLKFTYPGAQEYNHVQKIRSDGRVSLPLIGQVQAAGKNVGSLQEELVGRYNTKLTNKEVIVSVETTTIPVYVSGAVNRPGRVVLDRSMTALEAVMEANGFSPRANPKRVVLIRQDGGHQYTKTLDLSSALKGEMTESFYLKPYDVIHVPESFF